MQQSDSGAAAPGPVTPERGHSVAQTTSEAQRARILEMLAPGVQRTTLDFRRVGIMQSSTRIFELRALGYNIVTVARRDLFDAEGYRHQRVAVYEQLPAEGSEQ
jgi:Helix-turn-helix domain